MGIFGDDDPEDAYDASDPAQVKALILLRMLLSVEDESQNPTHDHLRAVTRIAFGLAVIEDLRQQNDPRLRIVLIVLMVGFLLLRAEEGP